MKEKALSRYSLTLALAALMVMGSGLVLSAKAQQQSPGQYPQQQQQQRRSPDQTQQTPPDSEAQQQEGQVFAGTIVKSGDKYVLQEESSGTTYDVDHQEAVKKFEGKKVRIHGTLDPNGKMIHIQ